MRDAVRDAMTLFEHKFTDDLLDLYLQKDFNKFWETWQKIDPQKYALAVPHRSKDLRMTEILQINLPITSAALIWSSVRLLLNVMILLMNFVTTRWIAVNGYLV